MAETLWQLGLREPGLLPADALGPEKSPENKVRSALARALGLEPIRESIELP
jgi:hypothetical protein